ncbi:hypothetical protein D3C77_327370 [compost metagenome]
MAVFQVGQAEQGQAGRRRLGAPHGLQRRQLHLLVVGQGIARLIAQDDDRQRGQETEGGGHGHRPLGEPDVLALQQIEGRDAQHDHGGADVTGRDGVDELGLGHRVEEHRHEVGDLHAHGVGIEGGADRVLHPAVGDQDPQRRQVGAQGDHEGDEQVGVRLQLVPAEEHQADEGRLEEEGHQALDRQRRPEDVPDVVGVVAPVHAELEFHGQAGRDAQHEVDAEDRAPEAGDGPPDRPTGHHIDALHDDQHEGKAQGEGHEQKVV